MELLLLNLLSTWGLVGLERTQQYMVRCFFAMHYMWFGRYAETKKILQSLEPEESVSLESLQVQNLQALLWLWRLRRGRETAAYQHCGCGADIWGGTPCDWRSTVYWA